MMARRPEEAAAGLMAFCDAVIALVAGHHDRRLVQVVIDTLTWARDNRDRS
ncbi:transcriptional regulator GlxA family with amidase domain [Sphingomonas trueperi]